MGFPRARARGSIEARQCSSANHAQCDVRLGGFRAHVRAAPLKQGSAGGNPDARVSFRAHVRAAPLKLFFDVSLDRFRSLFPRARARGSIEARLAASPVCGVDVVSARTCARLH